MKSGQFYKGMIDGIETTYESPDILQILPQDKLAELWDQDKLGTHTRIFLSDRVVAKTKISKAKPDEHGRDGITNHTILYRFDPTTEHDGVTYLFDFDQFSRDARNDKFDFKMPPTPELKRPLDLPPPLEVPR